jgi:membrane protein DedA with SNARE-associated domain
VALFVLLVLEEAGAWLPLPGDLAIMYFGTRIAHARHPLVYAGSVVLTVTAAALCGSLLLYLVMRRFQHLVHRLGPLIHLDERRLAWMEDTLRHHGTVVIIPARLVPGLRVATTAVAGAFRVPVARFLPAVTIAAVIWAMVYLALGAAGRSLWDLVRGLVPDAPLEWVGTVLAIAALVLLLLGGRRLLLRLVEQNARRGSRPGPPSDASKAPGDASGAPERRKAD